MSTRTRDARPPVVVFGHTGFIGGAVARDLTRRGFPTLAVSSRECNLLDPDAASVLLRPLPDDTRVVLCSGIPRVIRDSYETMLQNVRMIETFAVAARRRRLGGIIYLSSADVYGLTPDLPITESTPVLPESYYALSKFAGERLLRVGGGLRCPVTVLRLPGTYGAGDGDRSVVGRLARRIAREGVVTIHGDGTVLRDYVDVDDVCALVGALLDRSYDGVLNVATGASVSIAEIVDMMARRLRRSPSIRYAPPDPAAAGHLVFDVTTLARYLPGHRLKLLEEGLGEYLRDVAEDVRAVK